MTNIIQLLKQRATYDQSILTPLLFDGQLSNPLTYRQLHDKSCQIAGFLQKYKIRRGERIALIHSEPIAFLADFMGCLYAGLVPVPMPSPEIMRPNRILDRINNIILDCKPAAVLTSPNVREKIPREMICLSSEDAPCLQANPLMESEVSSEDLAFIQYTSGSTSDPKGVLVTHGNLMNNLEVIRRSFVLNESTRGCSWLPFYHDMGLVDGLFSPIYNGFHSYLIPTLSFLQRPAIWLETVSQYGVTYSGGPNFAYDLCVRKITAEDKSHLNLSAWKTAYNGAEYVRHETLEDFSAAFGLCGFKRESFFPCYGLAESTLMVTGAKKSDDPAYQVKTLHKRETVGCGRPQSGIDVLIVDSESLEICDEEKIGEIWVRGTSVTRGYFEKDTETSATFHAKLAGSTGVSYLKTGDLGFLSDGELFISGRLKDLIVINGVNHYPQDLELVAEQSHPSVRAGCCAAFSENEDGSTIILLTEVNATNGQMEDSHLQEIAANIQRSVSGARGVPLPRVALLPPSSLLKTSSGKIRRRACREAYLSRSIPLLWDGQGLSS